MADLTPFDAGFVAGVATMLAAVGVHWLITPARHPESTSVQRWGTIILVVLSAPVAVAVVTTFR